jgi:hypothetical protein
MAKVPRFSYYAANAAADGAAAKCNSGLLKIYTGRQPNSVNSAAWATHKLLATLTLNAAAFAASSAGVITAAAITADSAADTAGTASWFRILMAAGNTAMFDGNVGKTAADFNMALSSVTVAAGANVALSALTITIPRTA